MTQAPLTPAIYIETSDALHQLVASLSNEHLLAVDTESNSLHAYREKVCLIQLSTRTQDYIIDPIHIGDVQALGSLLSNPQIEKIFHAAEYDIGCLKRDYGFSINNLFDTMWAARICSVESFGLGALLEHYFDIKVDKHHQRDNWGVRPLPAASLLYAQMDTHYLPELRDKLQDELAIQNRLEEAQEIFEEVSLTPELSNKPADPEGYWYLGLPNSLTRKQMAILRELYLLREDLARNADCPPFKVFTNKTLVSLAEAAPQSDYELYNVKEMLPAQIRRYGSELLQAIERGRGNRLPSPPHHESPEPVMAERFTVLSEWRKGQAARRGVGADVIISKGALWEIARRVPKSLDELDGIRGLGPWRLKTYGPELLDVMLRLQNGSH